jgi:hypothetical protein
MKGFTESITDELSSSRQTLHSVVHRKQKWDFTVALNLGSYTAQSNVGGIIKYTPPDSSSWWGRLANLNILSTGAGLGNFNTATGVGAPLTPPDRWSFGSIGSVAEDGLKEDCFEKARELKADVLQDLVEYNQVWPGVKSMATALPLMKVTWPTLRRLIKNANAHTVTTLIREYLPDLGGIARSVSGGYLAYKFGVLPVLQDFLAINRYLPKLADDLKRHEERPNLRFSSKAEAVASFNSADLVSSQYGFTSQVLSSVGKVLTPPTVRYVLLVRPRVHELPSVIRKNAHFIGRFTTSPAKLSWDLIPFSFVVDWFLDMRGLLRAIDNAIGFAPYEVIGMTRSYTYKLSSSFKGDWRTTCAANLSATKGPLGDVEFTHYDRHPVSFAPSKVYWKPRFGKNQAAVSAALITQAIGNLTH